MTREEVIENMRKLSFVWEIGKQTLTQKQIDETLDMVFKILKEEPKAHWIDNHKTSISCSYCHSWLHKDDRYFLMEHCPFCCAKMESEDAK